MPSWSTIAMSPGSSRFTRRFVRLPSLAFPSKSRARTWRPFPDVREAPVRGARRVMRGTAIRRGDGRRPFSESTRCFGALPRAGLPAMAVALTGLSDSNEGGHGVGTALRGEVLSTWMTFPAHVAGFVIQVYAPGARRDVMPLDGHAAARSS